MVRLSLIFYAPEFLVGSICCSFVIVAFERRGSSKRRGDPQKLYLTYNWRCKHSRAKRKYHSKMMFSNLKDCVYTVNSPKKWPKARALLEFALKSRISYYAEEPSLCSLVQSMNLARNTRMHTVNRILNRRVSFKKKKNPISIEYIESV